MGFFKSILSEVVGEENLEALNGVIPGKKSEPARGPVAPPPPSNPLHTPPPPPVPRAPKALSVMIAVNGQTFGPYERATLLEMIGNGSLTPQTYVYIKGMRDWAPASSVSDVAELFDNGTVPPTPPVPWSEGTAPAPPSNGSDNSLSPRLNQLITAAIADGAISDLERQVLIRNAQEEGVAMDEFVMVLEARLFEQQQKLKAQADEKVRRDKAVAAQAAAATAAARNQASAARPKLQKCPHCGAPYDELSTRCPECGRDYPSAQASGREASAWERLAAELLRIDRDPKLKDDNMVLNAVFGNTSSKGFVKARYITNFPIPISKTDLFEFFTNCAPLAIKKQFFNTKQLTPAEQAIGQAYYDKCQQTIVKARIVLKDDKEMLRQLEELAKQYKIKA